MSSELRYKVLDQSLQIEHALANILSKIISVDQNGSKTLSNKSSAIPFKVKADFLYDLKRISKEEYNLLILFMEIRNQLIHNFDVDTMEKVLIVVEKKQKILSLDAEIANKYIESNNDDLKERFLNSLLDKLHIEILRILQTQFDLLLKDIEIEQQNRINEKLAESNGKLIEILIETQKVVGEKFSSAFIEDDTYRQEIMDIIAALFYKEFKEKVESHFGKLDL